MKSNIADRGPPEDRWDDSGSAADKPLRVFTVADCDALAMTTDDYVLKNLWSRGSLNYIAGPSGSRKSFLSIAIMSAVARGDRVLDRRTRRSGGVYIASEGASGAAKRFIGLRNETGPWNHHLRLIPHAPNLRDEKDVEALHACLLKVMAEMAAIKVQLGLVIIDTLSASIPGADENSAKDMSPVLTALQSLAVDLDVCMVVIAHLGKDEGRGIRGWSGLFANADSVIIVQAPNSDGTGIATITKVKDGEAGGQFAFGLQVIDLGSDADGDSITTCMIEWRDLPQSAPKEKKGQSIKPDGAMIMVALRMLEDSGAAVPVCAAGAPPGTKGVALKTLEETAFSNGLGGVEPDDPLEKRRWMERRRKTFSNHIGYLVRDGHIRSEGRLVWRIIK